MEESINQHITLEELTNKLEENTKNSDLDSNISTTMEVPIHKSSNIQELIEYIKLGDDKQVKVLFVQPTKITIKANMEHITSISVEAGCMDNTLPLQEYGLNVNTALDVIVNSNKNDIIELLLARDADVEVCLYFDVNTNKKNAITLLLALGANINTNQGSGNTPLHTALMQNICDYDLVEFLINTGANVQTLTIEKKTSFELFQKFTESDNVPSTQGQIKKINRLLSQNNKYKTLQELIEYVTQCDEDRVKRVFDNQPYIKTRKNMRNLAQIAVEAGSKDILVILLNHGLKVNVALDVVISTSNGEDLIEFILIRKADINEGLYFAVKANKKDVITFLVAQGANINTINQNGNTPLHTALMQKQCDFDLVEFLIIKGANAQIQTKKNQTPLELFQKFLKVKCDAGTKKKIENIAILLSDNRNNNIFECLMGLPNGLSGYSYQTKMFTLYAIMNTKQSISCACQYELSTEVKNLVPFDDIYLRRKTQEGRTSCEFIQVKQTKKPEFNKICPSKFFTMLKPECKIKEHIKGNDSIIKMFLKLNQIQESHLNITSNTYGVFIHCENTTFQDNSSTCLKRNNADNSGVLCGIKRNQWIIDEINLFIEIKYVLLNLIKTSPYFAIMNEDIKINFESQTQILEKVRNENKDKHIDEEILSSTKNIAMEGLNAIEKYLTHLHNCKRKIEKAIDTDNVYKNLPDKFELIYTDNLELLINRAVSKINEVYKSFSVDKYVMSYFLKFDDAVLKNKISNFVKHFSIFTDCPTSDELDKIISEEIGEVFKFDIPKLISAHCLQYFFKWISIFKNERGSTFTDKDGKKLFNDIKIQIFNAFNKSYIEELQQTELYFRQNNEQIMQFLNNDNNCKMLHVITQHTRLHAIHILQTIKYIEKQSTILYNINNVVCTSLEHVIKSDANLKMILDVLTSQDSSDILVLECSEEIEQEKISVVLNYLINIITSNDRKKVIIIAKNENQLATKLKIETTEHITYNETLTYNHLTCESQQSILKKSVNFLNNPKLLRTNLTIENFIKISAECEVIDESLLSTIVTCTEDIQIGNENAFISDEYNRETFVPRFMLNIDESILQKCICNLFFVTGITKNELLSKVAQNEQSIYLWEKNKVYNKGIVLMSYSCNVTSEEIFKSLVINNKHCHWLEFREKLLYFNGKDFTKEYEKSLENIFTDHKIASENMDDKIVIIANNPGEGKTTMLTHLACSVRYKSLNSWIVRIDLRYFANDKQSPNLSDITFKANDTVKAVELITLMAIKANSADTNFKLERKLFHSSLNGSGEVEVVLLFDCFDEISPKYKEKTCILLKALSKTNVKQLWVTTRVHLKEYLENELETPARMLAGFTKSEQIEFVCKFWKWHLKYYKCTQDATEEQIIFGILKRLRFFFKKFKDFPFHHDMELKYDEKSSLLQLRQFIDDKLDLSSPAKLSLELWEKTIKNRDFLKNPLLIELLTKYVIQRDWRLSNFPNSLLFTIYTDLVDSKFEIYYKKKTNRSSNRLANDDADMAAVLFSDMHREIAVKTLFEPSRLLPDLNICTKYKKFLETLAKVGLVKLYNGRAEFLNRTFAEYFFSDYLVTHLDDINVQSAFLANVLFDENYRMVRTFFDGFLLQQLLLPKSDTDSIQEHEYPFKNILSEEVIKLKNTKDENILHVAVREGHMQILLLIFNNVTKSELIKLVKTTSSRGLTLNLTLVSYYCRLCKNVESVS